jgi:hypothetical protein
MTNTKWIGVTALSFVLGAALGRYSLPAKIVTKTEIQTQIKTITIDKSKVHTVETKKPDGTVITVTDINRNIDENSNDKIKEDIEKTVTYNTQQWLISGVAKYDFTRPTMGLAYGAEVKRRLLGPIWVGALGTSDGTGLITIGVSF